MKLITKAINVFDRTNNLLAYLAVVLLIFLMLSISYEVVQRYFLGRATIWLFEVWEYCLLFIAFLSAAWVLKREGHVKMDIVIDRLKPKVQAIVNIITSIIGAITCLVVALYGLDVTWDYFQTGEFRITVMYLPKWPLFVIIPVGSFLLFIQFLIRAYGYLKSQRAS